MADAGFPLLDPWGLPSGGFIPPPAPAGFPLLDPWGLPSGAPSARSTQVGDSTRGDSGGRPIPWPFDHWRKPATPPPPKPLRRKAEGGAGIEARAAGVVVRRAVPPTLRVTTGGAALLPSAGGETMRVRSPLLTALLERDQQIIEAMEMKPDPPRRP